MSVMRWKDQRGSASIFFMIILSSIVTFQLVLVDFAMLYATKMRAQYAVDAAIRSVYAGYDSSLQTYGLYGVDADSHQSTSVFVDTLNKNLTADRWMQDETGIEHIAFLSDRDVFRYQMLEEMKYRAPIEFTMSILDKWEDQSTMEDVEQSKQLSHKLRDIEDVLEKRKYALNQAADEWNLLMINYVRKWHAQHAQVHEEIKSMAEKIKDQTKETIQASIARLETDIKKLKTKLEDLEEEMNDSDVEEEANSDDGQASSTNVQSERKEIEDKIDKKNDELEELEELLEIYIDFAALIGEHVAKITLRQELLQQRINTITQYLEDAQHWNRQAAEKAGELDEDLETMVFLHDDTDYARWLSEIGEVDARFTGYQIQFDVAKLLSGSDFLSINSKLKELNDAFLNAAERGYGKFSSWYEQQKARDMQKEEQENKLTNDAKGTISKGLEMAASCTGDDTAAYAQLKDRFTRYSNEQEGANSSESTDWDEPDETVFDAFDMIETLNALLLEGRDRAYVNEYVLSKFNYRTMESSSTELSAPHEHRLLNQEAEYILYGWNDCHLNHGTAYGEMFLLRLAIRTVENLLSPERSALAFGSPWLVFLWAISEGAIQAVQDMGKLLDGKAVEVSSRLPASIKMDYKDYLRLFMFLHGQESAMQARIQALIDLNTGIDLRTRSVLTSANAVVSYDPIIIPTIKGIFGLDASQNKLLIPVRTSYAY